MVHWVDFSHRNFGQGLRRSRLLIGGAALLALVVGPGCAVDDQSELSGSAAEVAQESAEQSQPTATAVQVADPTSADSPEPTDGQNDTTDSPEPTEAQNDTTDSPEPTEAQNDTTDSEKAAAEALTHFEPGCIYLGTDSWGDMSIEVGFVSTVESVQDVEFGYVLVDSSGKEFYRANEFVELVHPGEKIRAIVDTQTKVPEHVEADAISCRFEGIVSELGVGSKPLLATTSVTYLPGADDQCSVFGVDEYGELVVDITVANPVDDEALLHVNYVIRLPDNLRLDTGSGGGGDMVPAGAVIAEPDFSSWIEAPPGVPLTDLSCQILSIETLS